jgi:hypothetical protein
VSQRTAEKNQLIVSYLVLRQAVGWVGTLLPVVLVVGNAIFSTASRPDSMSGYYYTDMRNIFVGALCALGVFLGAYDGYDDVDRWITNVAGLGAIGAALCPTKPAVPQPSTSQLVAGGFHLFFAAVTFVALGLMALRFAKAGQTPPDLPMMERIRYGLGFGKPAAPDRGIYRFCGIMILSCVVLAPVSNLLPASVNAHWPVLFILEAVAVFAFGVSWFVKGQTIKALGAPVRKWRARSQTQGTGAPEVTEPSGAML